MNEAIAWPQAPKIPLKRYLREPIDAGATPKVDALEGVTVKTQQASQPTNWLEQAMGEKVDSELLIDVPADFHSEEPLTITAPTAGSARVVLNVGENARLRLQENWPVAGDFSALSFTLVLAQGAQVTWVTYSNSTAKQLMTQRTANLDRDAVLNWTIAGFTKSSGAELATVNLNGNGSHATLNVGALAGSDQTIGYTSTIENRGLKSGGHINQRGVITDSAHLVFNGIGHIVKGARGSDNQQENRVLMLDQEARGDANPILLIDENDVTAGHAASVARVDEGQLYYLMSRGLSEALAKRLVIRGFLEAGLSEITDQDVKHELFDTIDKSLVKIND